MQQNRVALLSASEQDKKDDELSQISGSTAYVFPEESRYISVLLEIFLLAQTGKAVFSSLPLPPVLAGIFFKLFQSEILKALSNFLICSGC